ncbi:hypothetical protein BJV74DRAFT_971089 [Russula compacta]|nr:hypothetical protein BJV74DRAFT_971089 [Russula compacta]
MMSSPSSSVLSGSSSILTPTSSTPSTSTITPATYAAAAVPTTPISSHRPYPLSASAAHAGPSMTLGAGPDAETTINPRNTSRIPVTPAVLRGIFASSRSPGEERSLSRIAFFRFSGFIISCLAISLMANQGRGIRTGAALLGVGV